MNSLEPELDDWQFCFTVTLNCSLMLLRLCGVLSKCVLSVLSEMLIFFPYLELNSASASQIAWLGLFFLTPMPRGNKMVSLGIRTPRQSVELHQTGTFRTLYWLSYSAAAIISEVLVLLSFAFIIESVLFVSSHDHVVLTKSLRNTAAWREERNH